MPFPGRYTLRPLLLLVTLLCLAGRVFASDAVHLTPTAHISLVTVDGGGPLYTAFGHSAVRVLDDDNNLDVVFNYGTFDFDAPGFYANFMKGRMLYFLSVSHYSRFLYWNTESKRQIVEQELRLTDSQRQRLFDFLVTNSQPENRDYLYNFFFDNCATRIRDAVEQVFGDSLQFADVPASATFRDLIHENLTHHPWSELGIDILLGMPCDRTASGRDRMFLPWYLDEAFAGAELNGRPLCAGEMALNKIDRKQPHPRKVTYPVLCMWLVLVLGVLASRSASWRATFDCTLFSLAGLVGLLIAYLWFLSDHTTTHQNLNIIWALPTHIVMVYFLCFRRELPWQKWYFRLTALLCLLLVILFPWLPQDLHPGIIPIALLLAYRALAYSEWPMPWQICPRRS